MPGANNGVTLAHTLTYTHTLTYSHTLTLIQTYTHTLTRVCSGAQTSERPSRRGNYCSQ